MEKVKKNSGGGVGLVLIVNIICIQYQSVFTDMQTNSSICICAYFTLFCLKATRLSKNYHFLQQERERERGGRTHYAATFIESEGCVRFPKLQIMTFSLVWGWWWGDRSGSVAQLTLCPKTWSSITPSFCFSPPTTPLLRQRLSWAHAYSWRTWVMCSGRAISHY